MAITFKGTPEISFRPEAKWNDDLSTIDFAAETVDEESEKLIVCRIAREALEDRAQPSGELEPLDMFERLKDEVYAVAAGKLLAGDFEPDDSVLVRSEDFND